MANTLNQKRRRAERTRAFLGELQQRFPGCFSAKREAVRPIAIGIQTSLRKALDADPDLADTPNWLIRQALAQYTRSPAYLDAVIAGETRIDLDGQPVEPVTAEAIALAREQRSEQKARAAERRRARAEAAETERQQARLQQLADRFNR